MVETLTGTEEMDLIFKRKRKGRSQGQGYRGDDNQGLNFVTGVEQDGVQGFLHLTS